MPEDKITGLEVKRQDRQPVGKGINFMRFIQFSAAKLNLSLRVTKKRGDGFHDIVSLFLRLPATETLSISNIEGAGSDNVRVKGAEIEGENIVSRALRRIREAGVDVPFLDVEISKIISPGSGLGAGSGNAAAVLCWLRRLTGSATCPKRQNNDSAWQNAALKTGADVPFLFSCRKFALVSGIGEILEPLESIKLYASIVLPEWSVGTENAYTQLDNRYGGKYPLSYSAARDEAHALHKKLLAGERIGLLPNDFAPALMEKFPGYIELFDMFDKSGHIAWGITGSGGAAFALSGEMHPPLAAAWPLWVRQILAPDLV